MYDVVIIGAGVIGAMTARTLAEYDLKICILEKENDIAMGATKANSAVVHAGFDAKPGSLKAKLNVKGSEMMPDIAKELGVKYKNNGSLVIGFSDEDKKTIDELYERGTKNGVTNLKILNGEEVKELEKNISDNVTTALYAPSGAIICPYELATAAVGNAMDNGAELKCNFCVGDIKEIDGGFEIISEKESVKTHCIVNAAGLYSDKIAKMAGDDSFSIKPRRGEYILLDKECGSIVTHTIFRTPSEMGKGILVSPTVDNNLILGPTSEDIDDKDNKETTKAGLDKVMNEAVENVYGIMFGKTITSFCGLRATGSTGDFIINSPKKGFVNAAGIESPGLSASPAIASMIVDMLKETDLNFSKRENYIRTRKPMHYFREATIEEKNEIIKKDKSYGKIVCRCEGVTEGEIREAIRTNPKPTDLDGVKRRTRAQMGRCQGGFCSPYIVDLIEEELGIKKEKVTKNGGKSYILTGKTKEDIKND